jgi:hypothetical protein
MKFFGQHLAQAFEPKCGLTRDTAVALYDLSDPIGRNMQFFSKLVHAHTEGFKKFLEDCARMNRRQLL